MTHIVQPRSSCLDPMGYLTKMNITGKKNEHQRMAIRVVFFYVATASLWILLSDSIVHTLFNVPGHLSWLQTVKGLVFVAVTGGLLYLYICRCLRKMHDIEQSAEVKAQQQIQQMATLFDSFNAIVYVADLKTHELLFVNRYAAEIFGQEWQGKTCYSYLQADTRDPCGFCTNPQLVKLGTSGPAILWEFQNTSDQRWYECLDKAILWQDDRLVRLEIAVDITERKELEKTKDELLSTVSHEMRTPLTAITGFAELLLDNPDVPDEVGKHLKIIFRESEKMIDLVNSFLDLRRLKTDRARVNYQPLMVEDVVAKALKMTRDCKPHHEIDVSCTPDSEIFGNRKELSQAISQLISNACRFSPDGGLISVQCETTPDEVLITVIDEGIGISQEQQPKVFDNFFRIDCGDTRQSGGVGLGLALVKDIIELHGGRIWLNSTPGKGSHFFIALPKHQATAEFVDSGGDPEDAPYDD